VEVFFSLPPFPLEVFFDFLTPEGSQMANCAALTMNVEGVEVTLKVHATDEPAPGDPPGAPKPVAFDFSRLFKIGMCVASCIAAPSGGEPSPIDLSGAKPVGPTTRPAR